MPASKTSAAKPRQYRPETRLVQAGVLRSQFGETSEALFLTQGYVYDSAEAAEARFKGEESGYIYSRFSNSVRAFDQQQIAFGTLTTPPRDHEINLEFTYVAQIIKGWVVQPVYTYIWHPSGTGIRYPDAQVVGLRSIIRY